MSKIDVPQTHATAAPKKEERVYVEVPEEDLFEFRHPDIIINGTHYAPGKHYVSEELAGTINKLVKQFTRQQIQLNRPGRDKKAEASTSRGSGNYIDPNAELS